MKDTAVAYTLPFQSSWLYVDGLPCHLRRVLSHIPIFFRRLCCSSTDLVHAPLEFNTLFVALSTRLDGAHLNT